MKTSVVLLSLALVFLAVLHESSAHPGVKEVRGKQKHSSSDIDSSSADEKSQKVRVGGVDYETGSRKKQYSQDQDAASSAEKQEFVKDDFGNTYSAKEKSSKSSSNDYDGDETETYKKVSF